MGLEEVFIHVYWVEFLVICYRDLLMIIALSRVICFIFIRMISYPPLMHPQTLKHSFFIVSGELSTEWFSSWNCPDGIIGVSWTQGEGNCVSATTIWCLSVNYLSRVGDDRFYLEIIDSPLVDTIFVSPLICRVHY